MFVFCYGGAWSLPPPLGGKFKTRLRTWAVHQPQRPASTTLAFTPLTTTLWPGLATIHTVAVLLLYSFTIAHSIFGFTMLSGHRPLLRGSSSSSGASTSTAPHIRPVLFAARPGNEHAPSCSSSSSSSSSSHMYDKIARVRGGRLQARYQASSSSSVGVFAPSKVSDSDDEKEMLLPLPLKVGGLLALCFIRGWPPQSLAAIS